MLQDALCAREAWLAEEGNEDIADALPARVVPRLDLLPRQRRDVHPVHRRRRLDAPRRPPGVDDERDQPAHLAVAGRHRHRCRRHLGQTVQIAVDAGIIPEARPTTAPIGPTWPRRHWRTSPRMPPGPTSKRAPSRSRPAASSPIPRTNGEAGPQGPASSNRHRPGQAPHRPASSCMPRDQPGRTGRLVRRGPPSGDLVDTGDTGISGTADCQRHQWGRGAHPQASSRAPDRACLPGIPRSITSMATWSGGLTPR